MDTEERGRRRRAREAAGLTQQTLAERVGVRATTLSDWEIGRTSPHKVLDRLWAAELVKLSRSK